MKRLGTVLTVSGSKKLIVRGDATSIRSIGDMPSLNSAVVSKTVTTIGKVAAIMGPVDRPYIAVRAFNDMSAHELRSYVKEKVYIR
ncbi:MAG: Gar1/Naf1 family protein [Methanosarcinaceae archaeon]|nr:Gar1/Naf1 family protein [Methanosarcinaceae archaeon]